MQLANYSFVVIGYPLVLALHFFTDHYGIICFLVSTIPHCQILPETNMECADFLLISSVIRQLKGGDNKLQLYSYWRSSCAFRARIALNLKGIKYEYKAVNLLKGEHSDPDFLKLNPVGFVPVLVDGYFVISDSFAIIMYLEDKFTQRPLLPSDLQKRTINFQVAHIIASNIQPLHSVSVLNYIEEKVGPDEKLRWVQSVIRKGLTAIEILLKDHTGRYATGDEIFPADVFLAPQLYAATRFNVDMTEFPVLARLRETYNEVPPIREASPGNQPDAVSTGN